MIELGEAFVASGWLGRKVSAESLSWPNGGGDLLPLLLDAADDKQARLLAWACQSGARLTLGWPGNDHPRVDCWLGPRLMWWPRGVPQGRKVAWVSSRLGRAIDQRPDWFAVLRSATAKIDPDRDVLLTASGTTVDRFLERAAILFGLRRLRLQLDERRTLVDWLTRLRRQLWRSSLGREDVTSRAGHHESASLSAEVFVSPVIGTATISESSRDIPCAVSQDAADGTWNVPATLPLGDRVLIAAADQVLALQVRPNGNLHQLLRARLSDSAWPTASVWLALGEALVPAEVAGELQSLGAIGWWLFAEQVSSGLESSPSHHTLESRDSITEMLWSDGDYLVHWTRRRDGPWPGQSEADFVDDLLLSRETTNHSAFATLSRIVQQRRLIASAAGIRGDAAVVSFSACPLHELTQRRAFRPHRIRWDYEAYGLCVRREWLQSRGAKPVIYGDDDQWTTLADSDRPYFQLKTTRSRGGAKTIDWSLEEEWRVPQDLDLSAASRDDVLLFVPTIAEAQQITAISPWRVLVLNSSLQSPE
ncbi:MAG: hypothetical protein ACKV2Q_08775 [Planctomycetaceae bacterium]